MRYSSNTVILKQFEQYINIVKHVITNTGHHYHCNTFIAPIHAVSTKMFTLNDTNSILIPRLYLTMTICTLNIVLENRQCLKISKGPLQMHEHVGGGGLKCGDWK